MLHHTLVFNLWSCYSLVKVFIYSTNIKVIWSWWSYPIMNFLVTFYLKLEFIQHKNGLDDLAEFFLKTFLEDVLLTAVPAYYLNTHVPLAYLLMMLSTFYLYLQHVVIKVQEFPNDEVCVWIILSLKSAQMSRSKILSSGWLWDCMLTGKMQTFSIAKQYS